MASAGDVNGDGYGDVVVGAPEPGGAAVYLGSATGLATTRFLGSILYGVNGTDPLTLTGAVVLLVITIMLACYVPARRAAAVDPAKTLAEQ